MSEGALSNREGPSRRFEARTAAFARRPTVLFVGAQVVLVAWQVLAPALGRPSGLATLTWAPGLVAAITWAAFLLSWLRPRRVQLEVRGEQLLLNDGQKAYSLSCVSVGEWREFGLAVRKGTVLHVGNRARTLRIAVEDRVPWQGFASTASGTVLVDLVADSNVFGALLAFAGNPPPRPFVAEREGSSRRWELTPNRTVLHSSAQNMVIMVLWSAVCVLIAGTCAETPFEVSTLRPLQQGLLTAVMVVGIIGWPLLLWHRSAARRHAVEVDHGDVRLVDTRRGVVLAKALAGIAAPATYFPPWWADGRFSMRGAMKQRYGTYAYPVLLFQWPTGRVTSVGIHDFSVAWAGATRRTRAPAYLLGKADWRALSDALGLRERVVEKE